MTKFWTSGNDCTTTNLAIFWMTYRNVSVVVKTHTHTFSKHGMITCTAVIINVETNLCVCAQCTVYRCTVSTGWLAWLWLGGQTGMNCKLIYRGCKLNCIERAIWTLNNSGHMTEPTRVTMNSATDLALEPSRHTQLSNDSLIFYFLSSLLFW